MPNLHANLIDSLQGVGWDPERTYSAPWQSGLTGIAYNKSKVKEVRSFEELLTRSDLRGRISLLTEMRDTMGLIMLTEGADPADFDQDDWDNAIDRLRKARNDGQVRAFTGNDYIQDLSAGNILACEAWSGDVAAAEDENLVFVSPEEGQMIWSDNMLIPNLATHQATPRSGSTTTTTRRWPRSSRRTSGTSARSRVPRRRWRRSIPASSTTS